MQDIQQVKANNASFVIFAAQPAEPHDVMGFFLEQRMPFKVLLGCYNGMRETSYCVPALCLPDIIDAGLLDEQDSILILNEYSAENEGRKASIRYANGDIESIGYLVAVPTTEALAAAGWTFDPAQDKFFIVK